MYFNNPNQLAYWALLSASIVLVLTKDLKIGIVTQLVLVALFLYLGFLGLSKAASISVMLLVLIHFSRNAAQFITALTVGAIVYFAFGDAQIFLNVEERLVSIGQDRDDNLLYRGYFLIFQNPEQLLFGAGEFGLERFQGASFEIHSTFAVLLFSYGAIGTILFTMALWHLYRSAGLGLMLYLLPAFTFGITHQGLRFSFFWVLIGVIAMVGDLRRREKSAQSEGDETKAPTVKARARQAPRVSRHRGQVRDALTTAHDTNGH